MIPWGKSSSFVEAHEIDSTYRGSDQHPTSCKTSRKPSRLVTIQMAI